MFEATLWRSVGFRSFHPIRFALAGVHATRLNNATRRRSHILREHSVTLLHTILNNGAGCERRRKRQPQPSLLPMLMCFMTSAKLRGAQSQTWRRLPCSASRSSYLLEQRGLCVMPMSWLQKADREHNNNNEMADRANTEYLGPTPMSMLVTDVAVKINNEIDALLDH